MGAEGNDEVRRELSGGVLTLTLDRPAVRNALGGSTLLALQSALEEGGRDPEVRCIVLTGAGERVFCSGADLSASVSGDGFWADHALRGRYATLLATFSQQPKPTVARLNGLVLAGGLGLALACDLSVAADDIQLGLPEVERGLFPMMVTALLQRHVGRKRALELLLLGERIDARTAQSWGLINRVVPRAELDGATAAVAKRLAGLSPATLALGRRAYFTAESLPVPAALDHLHGQLGLATQLEDAAEGVTAFLEKRTPNWKGK